MLAPLLVQHRIKIMYSEPLMACILRYKHPWGVNHGAIRDEDLFKQLRDWTLAQVCGEPAPHCLLVCGVVHCCRKAVAATPVKPASMPACGRHVCASRRVTAVILAFPLC